mgnify:CR=1 FL=1
MAIGFLKLLALDFEKCVHQLKTYPVYLQWHEYINNSILVHYVEEEKAKAAAGGGAPV